MDHEIVGESAGYIAFLLSVHLFHQHRKGLPRIPVRCLRGKALDEVDEPLHAVRHFFRIRLVREIRGRRAGPFGIYEGEGRLIADLPHHIQGVLKVLLCLAGETDDDIRGDGDFRDFIPDPPYQREVGFLGVMPVHPFKDPAAPGLQRQMNVPADLGLVSHDLYQIVGQVLRMGRHETDPLQALDPAGPPEKVRKAHRDLQCLPVRIHVLAEEHDLLYAVLYQSPDLREDVLRFPAPLPSSDIGDDAVSAEIVASVGDIHPGLEAQLPLHRHMVGVVVRPLLRVDDPVLFRQTAVEKLREAPKVVGPEDQVHKAVACPYPDHLVRFLHHAAADADQHVRMVLLKMLDLPQMAVELLVRVLPDGAGVEEKDVRLFGLRLLRADLREDPGQLLRVPCVHLAAHGGDMERRSPSGLLLSLCNTGLQFLQEKLLTRSFIFADSRRDTCARGTRALHFTHSRSRGCRLQNRNPPPGSLQTACRPPHPSRCGR